MKHVLLVYLPFCTPASPPYSLASIYSFLKANSSHRIETLDLNLEFHKIKFNKYQKFFHNISNWHDYAKVTSDYMKISSQTYSQNNKAVLAKKNPELLDDFIKIINEKKPDVIALSIVYSSQAFYAHALIKALTGKDIVVGGPAVDSKLKNLEVKHLNSAKDLLEYIEEKKIKDSELNYKNPLDFSIFNLNNYFTPQPIIPLKATSTCFYKKCTFCTHYSHLPYFEYDLATIKKTIQKSKAKHFFFIDDMIPKKMLLELAKTLSPLKVRWTCQLRPTKELDLQTLKILRESGVTMIMWGVESATNRILNLINKGTNIKDIEKVLKDSHTVGIRNIAYLIFGFPTETKEEFINTIQFLKENSESIDLISTSIFGLRKNTPIYNNPDRFGITLITENERTVLDPKINYTVKSGLSQDDARKLRQNYKQTIEKINKFPKTMNFFREHMFCSLI